MYQKENKIEIDDVTKRQQIDQVAETSRKSLMDHPHSDIIPHPEVGFSWHINKNAHQFSEKGNHTKLKYIKERK